jgi:colanic acid/amylovoran biosynthesis glycosyltransferase
MSDLAAREKPVVLIYAEPLLARSMTFIRTQAEALNSFSPYYISPRYQSDGLPLPQERVVVMRRGQGGFSRLAVVPFKFFGVAPLFIRRLRKLRPVLLHAHFGFGGLRALPLARALGIPLAVTFQGCDATMHDEHLRKNSFYAARDYVRRRHILNEEATLLISVSSFIRDEMIRQGFSANKIVVHYAGVDTELFCPEPGVTREPIVLFAGRLDEKKGCEYLIRAMAKVQSRSPEMELMVIGDGPLRADLEQLAHQHLGKYRFLGFQPPETVRHWMNRARIFGAPSIRTPSGDAEGYPNAFAEAQAMKLPVVSFASDGVREAVAHNETGFLAPERDTETLAHYLSKLCGDEDLCIRMGEAARQRVCKEFDLRTQTRKLEELYSRTLRNEISQARGYGQAEGGFGERIAAVDAQG